MYELQGVGKLYGEQAILRGINLHVGPGDLLLIRGPSGSGKTTLLRLLGLVEAPSSGEFRLRGHQVNSLTDEQRAILRRDVVGHVFQGHNMIEDMTLLENVALPMRLRGLPDLSRARSLLAAMGLAGKESRLPASVSLGERQRASFARALANDPAVILADEPTASIDASRVESVANILLDLWKQGRAVVVASHDPRLWTRLSGARVVEMEEGVLREVAE